MDEIGCGIFALKIDWEANRYQNQRVRHAEENAGEFIEDVVDEFGQEIEPALRDYAERERKTHNELRDLVEDYALNELHCEPSCVYGCTYQRLYSVFQLPACL